MRGSGPDGPSGRGRCCLRPALGHFWWVWAKAEEVGGEVTRGRGTKGLRVAVLSQRPGGRTW